MSSFVLIILFYVQVESHRRAAAATAAGKFKEEIIPVVTKVPKTEYISVISSLTPYGKKKRNKKSRIKKILQEKGPIIQMDFAETQDATIAFDL